MEIEQTERIEMCSTCIALYKFRNPHNLKTTDIYDANFSTTKIYQFTLRLKLNIYFSQIVHVL